MDVKTYGQTENGTEGVLAGDSGNDVFTNGEIMVPRTLSVYSTSN